jgi:ABC-type nitrate/sulfonate/bicarbonate transport system substrate-binding protein
MTNINKKLALLCLTLSAFFFPSFCGNGVGGIAEASDKGGKGYKANVIRIAYGESYTSVIPQMVMLKGFLENKLPSDVSVDWELINNGTDMRDALVSDNLDFGIMGKSIAVTAIENGLPILIMSDNPSMTTSVFSGNPEIKSLDDIKESSRIVVVAIGSTNHYALIFAARDLYHDPNKFGGNLMVMPLVDTFSAFVAKSGVDCAVMNFPFDSAVKKIEGIEQILDLVPYIKKYGITGTFDVRKRFYDENPALVDAVYAAMVEATDFMNDNPAEAAKILSKFYGNIDAAEIETQIKAIPISFSVSESAYNSFANFLYETGVLTNPPKKFSELPNYEKIPKTD